MARELLRFEFIQPWQRGFGSYAHNHSANNSPSHNPIHVFAIDPPGADNLNYVYEIQGFDLSRNTKYTALNPTLPLPTSFLLVFDGFPNTDKQHPIGIYNDTLIEIVIDRLMNQQAGPLNNNYIGSALDYLRNTLRLFEEIRKQQNKRVATDQTLTSNRLGGIYGLPKY